MDIIESLPARHRHSSPLPFSDERRASRDRRCPIHPPVDRPVPIVFCDPSNGASAILSIVSMKIRSLLAALIVVFAVSTTALLLVVVGGEPDDETRPKPRPAATTPDRKRPSPAVTEKATPKKKRPSQGKTPASSPIAAATPAQAAKTATLPPRSPSSPAAIDSTPSPRPALPARPTKTMPPVTPAPGRTYWIQVGAFSIETNAKSLARRLEAAGFEVDRLEERVARGRFFKVLVRSGATRKAARQDIARLRRKFGLEGLIASRPARR